MARFNKQTYEKIFDQLLSEELSYNAAFASDANIYSAMKKVLGHALKTGYILLYSDLVVALNLDVHFKIVDPDHEIISIHLIYGG